MTLRKNIYNTDILENLQVRRKNNNIEVVVQELIISGMQDTFLLECRCHIYTENDNNISLLQLRTPTLIAVTVYSCCSLTLTAPPVVLVLYFKTPTLRMPPVILLLMQSERPTLKCGNSCISAAVYNTPKGTLTADVLVLQIMTRTLENSHSYITIVF